MTEKILIFGGAGFIGSHICKRFVDEGYKVTVIDGLLNKTGGRKNNLQTISNKITFIPRRIEQIKNLSSHIKKADVIIDCMGWTSHLLALKYPNYDLELNTISHLCLIKGLENNPGKNVIYLGTRNQYGNPHVKNITEETKMEPLDVQGIHKLAAESYFRIFSEPLRLSVASLRLGGCFGPHQIINSEDIGLVGSFIKTSLKAKEIVLYGKGRKRTFLYAQDVAEVVFRLALNPKTGFNAYNFVGSEIYLENLIQKIQNITNSGTVRIKKMPKHIKRIDIGSAKVKQEKLKIKLGNIPITNLDIALEKTINYFKQNL